MTVAEYAELINVPEKFLRDYCRIRDFQTGNQESALMIPYYDEAEKIVRTRLRFGSREDKGMRWSKNDIGKPIIPYGLLWFNQHFEEAYLVEGETNTLTLFFEARNILGIPGVSTFKKDWITDYLMQIKTLYLAFDNDEAGRKCTRKVIEALEEMRFQGNVKVVDLRDLP